jgi:hypothetical protein
VPSTAPDAVHAVLRAATIVSQIARARKKTNQFPPKSVANLQDMLIEFTSTSDGGRFLIFNEWLAVKARPDLHVETGQESPQGH